MVSNAAVIKVASFNLKCDVHFGHKHRWCDRRLDAAEYIRRCGASIVGF